ncbi:MAG: 3-isopropylmalate dehydratase small subunit [Candidatus Altiarchaeota archaeon]|nr:3-isopropylmalate dehydratase small subunit [Candidatus Altiarchaeota archaeon]
MKDKVRGRVWKFASNVDTDQIIPAEYLVTGDPKELAKHAFEKVRPEFARQVKPGDIIVADDNFGCGSSREHAPRALMGCGVDCVIANSFARIFFRNSINIGLPLVECRIDAKEGEIIEVDFKKGVVINVSSGKEFKFKPLPEFLMNLMESGGLVEYVKRQLAK